MTAYILRRSVALLTVLFIVSVILFSLLKLVPGDPARTMAGQQATQEMVQKYREYLGLNKPLHIQYSNFITQLFTGNLRSMSFHTSVRDIIFSRLPATLELGLGGVLVALLISIPLGIAAAYWQGTKIDFIATGVSLVGISLPVFWTALLLMLLFGIKLGLLPISGRGETLFGWSFLTIDGLRHLVIPTIAIASVQMAMNTRLVRSSMLEVLRSEYVTTARSKGLSEYRVILKHVFRNALLPVVTNAGYMIGAVLAGGVLTETTTDWPGLGRLLYQALTRRDQSLLFTLVLLISTGYLLSYLLVDISYAYLNPKITYD